MAGGCCFSALGAVKTRSRACGGWTWPTVWGTAGQDARGFSPIRRRRGTSVLALCPRPSARGSTILPSSAGGSPTPLSPSGRRARSGTRRPEPPMRTSPCTCCGLTGAGSRSSGTAAPTSTWRLRSGIPGVRCSACRAGTSGLSWCWRPTPSRDRRRSCTLSATTPGSNLRRARRRGPVRGTWSPCLTGTAPGVSWLAALPSRRTGCTSARSAEPTARPSSSPPPMNATPPSGTCGGTARGRACRGAVRILACTTARRRAARSSCSRAPKQAMPPPSPGATGPARPSPVSKPSPCSGRGSRG